MRGVCKVHPRIRGEYCRKITSKAVLPGSPPHPRGIFRGVVGRDHLRGFTPASAGNIHFTPLDVLLVEGSPPHPRGIYCLYLAFLVYWGFTPASAGNMTAGQGMRGVCKVHPRIRGEYCRKITSKAVLPGSPPHPRGIYGTLAKMNPPLRFTPASAGNIFSQRVL